MGLTYNIQEAMELARESEARRAGVPERDIEFSRLCGMDAKDVRVFREFSGKGFLIVVRCPKPEARGWHGLIPSKPKVMEGKSGSSGVKVNKPGEMFVSDYDLMSIWRHGGSGLRKVFVSAANGAERGRYSPEATVIIKELNRMLVSRLQHGCQDDYCSLTNPGVKMIDHFASFCSGIAEYHANPAVCKLFYERNKLVWLYDSSGAYRLVVAQQELAH